MNGKTTLYISQYSVYSVCMNGKTTLYIKVNTVFRVYARMGKLRYEYKSIQCLETLECMQVWENYVMHIVNTMCRVDA